jgi:hypothetical protein
LTPSPLGSILYAYFGFGALDTPRSEVLITR